MLSWRSNGIRKFFKFQTPKDILGMVWKLSTTNKYDVAIDKKWLKCLDSRKQYNDLKFLFSVKYAFHVAENAFL